MIRLQHARIAPPAGPDHRTLVLWLLGFEQDGEAEIDRACEVFAVDPVGYSRHRPLYLTSDQVRQLAEEGFTLGSHGESHLPCQQKDPAELEREIVASCRTVCDITGQKSVPFAFPYSGEGIDRAFLSGLLERHKFIDLFFDTRGLSRDAPFIINRLNVDSPAGSVDDATNLERLIRSAWARRSAWWRGPGRAPDGSPIGAARRQGLAVLRPSRGRVGSDGSRPLRCRGL